MCCEKKCAFFNLFFRAMLSDQELKYTDKLTAIEKKFIDERKYYGCNACWIKYLRPTFLAFYESKLSSPYDTSQFYFERIFFAFDKCTHKPRKH
jgi:hypothetical protein